MQFHFLIVKCMLAHIIQMAKVKYLLFLEFKNFGLYKQNGLFFYIYIYTIYTFFFYLGFLSRTSTNHRTAGEGGGYFFNSSLPLPPTSQTPRHQPSDYCRELTSAHSQQQDSNREPLVSRTKNLQSPGTYISKRTWGPSQKAITKQTDRQLKNNGMCEFRGDLCKLVDWETFINEQKG